MFSSKEVNLLCGSRMLDDNFFLNVDEYNA